MPPYGNGTCGDIRQLQQNQQWRTCLQKRVYRISLTLQPYSCFVYTKVAIFWCKCSIMQKRWSEISSRCSLRHVPKVGWRFQVCCIWNLQFGWFPKSLSMTFIFLGRVAWNHRNHSKVFKCRSLYWWVTLESRQRCLSSVAISLKMFRSYPKLSDFSICILGDGSTWGHHVSTIQQAVSAECQGLKRCKSDAACLLKQSWRNNIQHASSTGCELQFCWRADRWVFRIPEFFL